MSKQSKYKNLSMNTLLFTISSFGAKIISFLLVPIYTSVLSTKDYGNVDLNIVFETLKNDIPELLEMIKG